MSPSSCGHFANVGADCNLQIANRRLAIGRGTRRSRPGFTLIEVSVGLIACSVLMLGLGGSVFLSMQANRTDLGSFRHSSLGATAIDEVSRELSYATAVRSVTPGRSVEVEVPDRTGDGAADVVRYEWSGTAGAPLQRRFNGGAASNVAAALEAFDLQATSRTVTEQIIGTITNTAGEAAWYEKSSALLFEGTVSLGTGDGVGTDFIPTLPAGALGWSVTKVEVRCRSDGEATGVVKARVWTADGNRKPATLLTETTINESSLPTSWNWFTVEFPASTMLGVNQRACITFQQHSGSNVVMQVRQDELGLLLPFLRLSTSNGGSSWSTAGEKAIYVRISGNFAYSMGGIVDVNRTYQTSISLEGQAGTDTTARMTGRARLRNRVEVAP